MKILMREDIDVCGTSVEAIAVLPQDEDAIYNALRNNGEWEERAKEIAYLGRWSSSNGCTILFVEDVEDWR